MAIDFNFSITKNRPMHNRKHCTECSLTEINNSLIMTREANREKMLEIPH